MLNRGRRLMASSPYGVLFPAYQDWLFDPISAYSTRTWRRTMIYRQFLIGVLMASILCAQRQLSDDETTNAYGQAARLIASKSPQTARIAPIEQTSMVAADGNSILVNLVVDLPKSYGVVRNYYTVRVSPLRHGMYRAACCIADTSVGDWSEQKGVTVNLALVIALRTGKRHR